MDMKKNFGGHVRWMAVILTPAVYNFNCYLHVNCEYKKIPLKVNVLYFL